VTALALPDLAQAIEREHQAVADAAQSALDHAVECGRLLIQAKTEVGHGDWLPWLEANCSVRPRTVQVYMRLARELPKLSEANTQRVAHLTVRDAIVAVTQNAAWIAALPAGDHNNFLELAETSGDRLVEARRQHSRVKWQAASELARLAVPPVHAAPGRRKRLMSKPKERRVMLVVGPNHAGLHLHRHMAELNDGEEHRAYQAEVDDLRLAADELERQAAELRREAKQKARELKDWSAATLIWQHGPLHPFIETSEFVLDAETFDELARLPEHAAIEALLDRALQPERRGHWGDISLLDFASLQPATGWTGIGNEHGLPPEVLASILPTGEDAP
jgi:hypothetical protein